MWGPVAVLTRRDRNLFGTLTYRYDNEVHRELAQILREEVPSIANVSGINPNIVTQPFYSSYFTPMDARGGNCVGLLDEAPGPLASEYHSRHPFSFFPFACPRWRPPPG